jgi:hypothetical protein
MKAFLYAGIALAAALPLPAAAESNYNLAIEPPPLTWSRDQVEFAAPRGPGYDRWGGPLGRPYQGPCCGEQRHRHGGAPYRGGYARPYPPPRYYGGGQWRR